MHGSMIRRVSLVLLTLEAILLFFPSAMAAAFLVAWSAPVWAATAGGHVLDALLWLALILALMAAWWLLLAFLYGGGRGARAVPRIVWLFAAIVALVSVWSWVLAAEDSLWKALTPAVIFVPTFLHLAAEVWLVREPRVAD